jgi:hypothetical protein
MHGKVVRDGGVHMTYMYLVTELEALQRISSSFLIERVYSIAMIRHDITKMEVKDLEWYFLKAEEALLPMPTACPISISKSRSPHPHAEPCENEG